MKYKLIASDFDGTLNTSDNTVTKKTAEAIKKYIDAGGIFMISTGRTKDSIIKRLPELGLDGVSLPVISFQGALVTDSLSGEVLYTAPMDNAFVARLVDIAADKNIYCHYYTSENVITEKESKYATMYCKYAGIMEKLLYAGDLKEHIKKYAPQILKVMYIDQQEIIAPIAEEVNAALGADGRFAQAAPMLIECVDNKAGKGNAMLYIAEKLGIKKEETLAIGDSMNDYTMIRAAGLGVAVGNADERLKGIAGFIAPSNDDDAVAFIIEKVLSGEMV